VVKQDSKQVLAGVELYLAQALSQGDVVPTNSDDAWYKLFRVLGSDHCTLRFNQSRDEKWIRIALVYDCPVISHTGAKLHASFKVLTLNSSAILSHCAAISRNATYLAEAQNRPIMHADRSTDFHKWVYFVLPRSVLAAQHQEVGGDLSCLLTAIARETTLIQQDNHARGDLVRVGHAAATAEELEQGRLYWTWSTEQLRTPVQECDPPEYWGDTALGGWMDFIGGTTRYPWMPGAVSSEEIPF
jgi:hypothetical protein